MADTSSESTATAPASMTKEQILSQLPDDIASISSRAPPTSPEFHFQDLEEPSSFGSRVLGFVGTNPFVAVGMVSVTYFLTSGLKSMVAGDRVRSQRMMRGRILSQGFICFSLVTGLLIHSYVRGDDYMDRIQRR